MARFELYERKIDDLEGEIEAYDMVQKTLADEIAVLETDEVVDAQLDELKARIKQQDPDAVADDVNLNNN